VSGGRGLSEYVAEATEVLEALGRDLLQLDTRRSGGGGATGEGGAEDEADPALLNAIFRSAHSLKGLSALFGQEAVARVAHAAEDLLDRLRLGKVPLDGRALDALVDALDVLNALLAQAARRDEEQGEGPGSPGEEGAEGGEVTDAGALEERARAAAARLERVAAGAAAAREEDPLSRVGLGAEVLGVLTEYEEHRLRESVRRGAALWRVRVAFALEDFDVQLSRLTERLKPHGELLSTLPSPEAGGAGDSIGFELLVSLKAPASADLPTLLSDVPGGARLLEVPVRPPAAAPGAAQAAARGGAAQEAARDGAAHAGPADGPGRGPRPGAEQGGGRGANVVALPGARGGEGRGEARGEAVSLRSPARTVRVDIARLDGLMNHVGELLLSRAHLSRLAEEAQAGGAVGAGGEGAAGTGRGAGRWGQELARESRLLERRLSALQKGLLEARMVPLQQVFDRLGRLVRRAARDAGKELSWEVAGGEVELDKLIVEELADPLMHIIRNALDHGVEAPVAREAAGKPRQGRLTLRASPRGPHVVLDVEDDGAGMDEGRIRDVALARGLLTRERAAELTRRDLLNLVFLPGFSTASEVSALSGRGVGLDVVKTNIAHLSGRIDVWSERGRGTRFTLTLPVTLAVLRALVVGAAGRTYVLPLSSVVEILPVTPAEVHRVERREVLLVRGQTVPLVRLSALLQLPGARPVERPFAVVVGLAEERLALAVDALEGQQDVVTKPLPRRLAHVRGIAGATELGGRQTVLLLDVPALVEEALRADVAAG
jgi:two-component system chemotaxis sensor kinase CheA